MVDSEIFETEKEIPSLVIQEKEPWLAVSASWLLPGAGHFYLSEYGKAGVFFFIWIFLYLISLASLLSKEYPFKVSIFLIVIYGIVGPFIAAVS